MQKTKFWLLQIAMVLIVCLAFGSPVWADDDDDDDGFNDVEWHEKYEAKEARKELKYENKMIKHEGNLRKQAKVQRKYDRWEKKHKAKLVRHNAKHHAGEIVEPPEVGCSVETPAQCTTSQECMEGGGTGWFPDFVPAVFEYACQF